MLWVNCSASQALTAGSVIPFSEIVCATNNNASLSSGTVKIQSTGWYITYMTAVLSSATSSVTVQLMADGQAVEQVQVTVPQTGTATVCMNYPIHVVPAQSGTATLQWVVSSDATVDSATLGIIKTM